MGRKRASVPLWADDIQVHCEGKALIVVGKRHRTPPVHDTPAEADLLEHAKALVRWGETRRQHPPHVEFANAHTDAALIGFVRKWGPIDGHVYVATQAKAKTPLKFGKFFPLAKVFQFSTQSWNIVVNQKLADLRKEQSIFASAARLIAELQSKTPDRARVFEHCARMVASISWKLPAMDYHRHRKSLLPGTEAVENPARNVASIPWKLDAMEYDGESLLSDTEAGGRWAEQFVCEVLNRFPMRLYPTPDGPVELPPLDSDWIGKGIKHLLYTLLRLEYLRPRGRLGLGVCRDPRCNKVFVKERRGALYCDDLCSKQHRSLLYYHKYGRAKRRARVNSARSAA